MKSEYLLFNSIVALGPILSLLCVPNIRNPVPIPAFVAILLTAFAFIAWDISVTVIFWTFNSVFTLGPQIGGVPFEEVLFFFVVPFGCLTLWVNVRQRWTNCALHKTLPYTLSGIACILGMVGLGMHRYYTGAVFTSFAICPPIDVLLQTKLFRRSVFLSFLVFTILLTFIFNLYLTARPIVFYNPLMKTGIDILTIPIEDFIYGVVLITLMVICYEYCIKLKFRERS